MDLLNRLANFKLIEQEGRLSGCYEFAFKTSYGGRAIVISQADMAGAKRRLFETPSSSKRARFATPKKGAAALRLMNRTTMPTIRKSRTVKQTVSTIVRAINASQPEVKYFDISLDTNNIDDATGAVIHLTAVGQGDTAQTRTGDSIRIKSISIKGSFTLPEGTTPGTFPNYRVGMVIDKQTVADTAPTVAQMFSPANPVTVQPVVGALSRFKYVWLSQIFDGRRLVASTTLAALGATPTMSPYFEYNWKGDMEVRYNGTASTDQEKNAVYFFILSGDSADVIDIIGNARIGFIDP